jgi:hypothetical protein
MDDDKRNERLNRSQSCYRSLYLAIALVGLLSVVAVRSGRFPAISVVFGTSVRPLVPHLDTDTAAVIESDDELNVRMESATTLATELANHIFQRFEFHRWDWFQFFLISWNISLRGWDILKLKLAKKIVWSAMRPAERMSFVMIFSGSAATAGYDNFYNQSYPAIIEQELSPIFQTVGVPLVVRNVAQSKVDCKLTNYCLAAMAGTTFSDISLLFL